MQQKYFRGYLCYIVDEVNAYYDVEAKLNWV